MEKSMVSFEKVVRKFQQLDEYLEILRAISQTPQKTFLKEFKSIIIKRYKT
jgi:hypothetical protein